MQRHAATMRAYLHAFLPPHEVDDQLQESTLAIWRGLSTLRTTNRPLPWMLGIARHRALRALHQRRKAPASLAEPEQLADRSSSDSGLTPEDLLRILQKLPEAYRVSLALRLLEQKGSEEIAQALDMTPGSVRVNLTRGMMQLRQHLRREGYP
jgi:RNA polymerase sigma-70 factor (ECF subfamily)